jgi:subtilisin family serine protease
VSADPLAALQPDMQMIHATAAGSYKVNPGNKGVLVGIIDTGVDGTHPDIAPTSTGAVAQLRHRCPTSTDRASTRRASTRRRDDDGHGTHVASTIAPPLNGIDRRGSLNVSLVNIRAGQDLATSSCRRSTPSRTPATPGIDVVNMSFYTDPWLFNCRSNPADCRRRRLSSEYGDPAGRRLRPRRRGVTLVAAAGNESTDIGKPSVDETSPTPRRRGYTRNINPADCLSMPAQPTA